MGTFYNMGCLPQVPLFNILGWTFNDMLSFIICPLQPLNPYIHLASKLTPLFLKESIS